MTPSASASEAAPAEAGPQPSASPSAHQPAKPALAVWIPRLIIGVTGDGEQAITIAPRAMQIAGRVQLAVRCARDVGDVAAQRESERCWDELECFGEGEC
jgi:hypothetical protein